MKSKMFHQTVVVTLSAALAFPIRMAAQEKKGGNEHHRYKLVDVSTFAGPESFVNTTVPGVNGNYDLNNRGVVIGGAATSIPSPPTSQTQLLCGGLDGTVPFVFHAFEWKRGIVTDLGALPGSDNCSNPMSINANGVIEVRACFLADPV